MKPRLDGGPLQRRLKTATLSESLSKSEKRMNRERIEETVRLWQAQPDKAKGNPTVIARAEGSKAVMEQGSFSWRTDGYNKVFDYKAGKADWQQANLQTETG
jgi:hypothetical protein